MLTLAADAISRSPAFRFGVDTLFARLSPVFDAILVDQNPGNLLMSRSPGHTVSLRVKGQREPFGAQLG